MRRRLAAHLHWYNHQRTSHALGGLLVPADRYYGRVEEVLARIEAGTGREGLEALQLRDRALELFRVVFKDGVPLRRQRPPRLGDTVMITLAVKTTCARRYVVVDDPLPAGLEAIDSTLATATSSTVVALWRHRASWWDHRELRDDRVLFFRDFVQPFTLTARYLARVTTSSIPGGLTDLRTCGHAYKRPSGQREFVMRMLRVWRMLRAWRMLAVVLLLVGCSDRDGSSDTNANNSAVNNGNTNSNGNDNGNDNSITNGNDNSNTNSNGNPACGNGVVDTGEACDGADLGGSDCASVAGLADGVLGCDGSCAFDVSGCWECGNGLVEAGEACDDGAGNCNDSVACVCATNCTLPGCGNDVVETYLGEQCDEGAGNCNGGGCTCSTTCTAPGDPCGYPLDGVWFEIDYSNASAATNPAWTFSATPGWSGQDWAPSNKTWPEVWDVYNNISIGWDPVGSVLAEVGGSSTLQIMIGLGGLTSYSYASVCVEGRSVSATSSVTFDVYNPLNTCGSSATMSHDWLSFHPTGIDLGTCLIPNDDFQAVRIETSGGSGNLGVIRVRVILHDAVY